MLNWRKRLCRMSLLLNLLLLTGLCAAQVQVERRGGLRYAKVTGTARERGVQQGQALKSEIHQVIKIWRDDIERNFNMPADTFLDRFEAHTNFLPAIRRHTPALLEELEGMAEGAEIDFKTLYLFQLIDELWAMGRTAVQDKCTTFGVSSSDAHPVIIGQNLDLPLFYGYQTLVHHHDPATGWQAFVFTIPGILGANGLSNAPVAVCVNTILQLKPSSAGLPVDFVVRGVLAQPSFDAAARFLKDVDHASGQNYLIADAEQMAGFECSQRVVTPFVPFKGAAFTYHTNHPLTNDNVRQNLIDRFEGQGPLPELFTSRCRRFIALKREFISNAHCPDLDGLKGIFQNREWIINNANTWGTTIMLMKNEPELHIAPGRPDEKPFQILKFSGK